MTSSTLLINQAVAEQRHLQEAQQGSRMTSTLAGTAEQNVGESERSISLVTGAVLAGLGLTRGGLCGLTMLGVGAALAYRGATGHCAMYQSLGINTAKA